MSAREIAEKIEGLVELISDETSPCGDNLSFYNDIAKELAKKDPDDMWKLNHIVNVADAIIKMKG